MKVLWSWQSDIPGKTKRHFVRQALADAIEALRGPEDIEEPLEREAKDALELDQDRANVPGGPDLVRTILDKIAIASVFVADVTPVSTIVAVDENNPEKRNVNPNVAIELGYALHALGDKKGSDGAEHVLRRLVPGACHLAQWRRYLSNRIPCFGGDVLAYPRRA